VYYCIINIDRHNFWGEICFLRETSYAYQGCIDLIKNTVK